MDSKQTEAKPEPDPRDHAIECCCSVCGSTDVEYAVWHNPNTGVSGEMFGSWNAGDNTACAECGAESRDPNPNLVDKDGDREEFVRLRAKWRDEHDEIGERTVEIDDDGNPIEEV